MKKILITIIFCFSIFIKSQGQSSAPYVTSGLEMIFSLANITDHGNDANSALRWAPVINIQSMLNKDLSNKFGLFTGVAVRNVGYIYDHYTDPFSEFIYKKKFRSYNLGIPVGVKIGNLDRMFIYGGYEIEIGVFYKEKTFDAGGKLSKITGFFSSRQEIFQHGFLVGMEFPYGINVKFKYYLSEFHNQDFVDGTGTRPYEGLHSQIFYFSLSSYLFRNFRFQTMAEPNEW